MFESFVQTSLDMVCQLEHKASHTCVNSPYYPGVSCLNPPDVGGKPTIPGYVCVCVCATLTYLYYSWISGCTTEMVLATNLDLSISCKAEASAIAHRSLGTKSDILVSHVDIVISLNDRANPGLSLGV